MENYERFINQIKAGGLPTATGLIFTKKQVDNIKEILDKRKKEIDLYFENCISTKCQEI